MKLTREQIIAYFEVPDPTALFAKAATLSRRYCGDGIYIRGIIEFSSFCVRNCLYCGLRRDNTVPGRYRMPADDIVRIACNIVDNGVQTVVLQSGDDLAFKCEELCKIIRRIKCARQDVAITLSVGERPFSDYVAFREAGADRYLMRHETSNPQLYAKMHPGETLAHRISALKYLRTLGYQIGCGFIVGLPGQTLDDLAGDILFIADLQPDMVGIGPFVPQADTPLYDCAVGRVDLTLRAMALTRMVTENTHLPATSALAVLDHENGYRRGLEAGGNVIMINQTPPSYHDDYSIYDGRARTDLARATTVAAQAGLAIFSGRGDSLKH